MASHYIGHKTKNPSQGLTVPAWQSNKSFQVWSHHLSNGYALATFKLVEYCQLSWNISHLPSSNLDNFHSNLLQVLPLPPSTQTDPELNEDIRYTLIFPNNLLSCTICWTCSPQILLMFFCLSVFNKKPGCSFILLERHGYAASRELISLYLYI